MPNEYPTEEELRKIKTWPSSRLNDLFDFIKGIWWQPSWGWKESEIENKERLLGPGKYRVLNISTGGWSGNEDIIAALRENWEVWNLTWVSSGRGGHFRFEVKELE